MNKRTYTFPFRHNLLQLSAFSTIALKIESENKYIVIKDKTLSAQLKEAFKEMSKQAVTFEQRTKKDMEQYTLTFKSANMETIYYDLTIREKSSNTILQIEKKIKS